MENVRISILSHRLAASQNNSVEQQQLQKELTQTLNVSIKKSIHQSSLLFDI
jgi:hypothetical protein